MMIAMLEVEPKSAAWTLSYSPATKAQMVRVRFVMSVVVVAMISIPFSMNGTTVCGRIPVNLLSLSSGY